MATLADHRPDTGPASTAVGFPIGLGVLAAGHSMLAAGRRLGAWSFVETGPLVWPFSWNHHPVLLLPALALLARRSWAVRRMATATGLVGVLRRAVAR